MILIDIITIIITITIIILPTSKYIIMKLMNKAIRCSYYAFCLTNKPWTNPDLFDHQFDINTLSFLF